MKGGHPVIRTGIYLVGIAFFTKLTLFHFAFEISIGVGVTTKLLPEIFRQVNFSVFTRVNQGKKKVRICFSKSIPLYFLDFVNLPTGLKEIFVLKIVASFLNYYYC